MSDAGGVERTSATPGPEGLAGALLLGNLLAQTDLDQGTVEVVKQRLADVLPGGLAQPGTVTDRRAFNPDQLNLLVRSAIVRAAGLDPAKTPVPPPPILWQQSGNSLLVDIAGVTATLGDGLIELAIPVRCDETGPTGVTVTFITGTSDVPSGGVTTTEDHPRGVAAVVENWHEPLIALAWRTVLVATSALAGVGGTDRAGRALVTNSLEVGADGLAVVPMARHTFARPSVPGTESLP